MPVENGNCENCWKCLRGTSVTRYIVCPDCGNKRCPKASDHENACTNSNEPGQPGSIYGERCNMPKRKRVREEFHTNLKKEANAFKERIHAGEELPMSERMRLRAVVDFLNSMYPGYKREFVNQLDGE